MPRRSKKRSLKDGDAPQYRDPDQIRGYYDAAHEEIKRKVRGVEKVQLCPYPEDSRRHFLTLWISGCREGEAVKLNPAKWTWNEEAVGYKKAPVLKKRRTVMDSKGNPVYVRRIIKEMMPDGSIQERTTYRKLSEPNLEYREILLTRDYPLAEEFINMVTELREKEYKYILYHRNSFSRAPVKDRACTPRTVQNRITELHPDLFPHAIRALQARYFRERYGKDFDTPELMDHFKWSSADMAALYLGAQKKAEILGITKLPF